MYYACLSLTLHRAHRIVWVCVFYIQGTLLDDLASSPSSPVNGRTTSYLVTVVYARVEVVIFAVSHAWAEVNTIYIYIFLNIPSF